MSDHDKPVVGNVHHLPSYRKGLIRTLEDMLDMARRDELASICIVGEMRDGNVASAHILDEGADLYALVGMMESQKMRLLLGQDESVGLEVQRISLEGWE